MIYLLTDIWAGGDAEIHETMILRKHFFFEARRFLREFSNFFQEIWAGTEDSEEMHGLTETMFFKPALNSERFYLILNMKSGS